MTMRFLLAAAVAMLGAWSAPAAAAGKLGIEDAWIRAAPPGVRMLAGYATLKNSGDEIVTVLAVDSDAFRSASIHETVLTEGVAKMREMPRVEVVPGGTMELKPGGRHFMLMQPRRAIVAGDKVNVVLLLGDGSRVTAVFDVLPAAKTEE